MSEPLTPRQTEVARLIALGKSQKAIARELGLSLATVNQHVKGAAQRLGGPGSPRHRILVHVLRSTQPGG